MDFPFMFRRFPPFRSEGDAVMGMFMQDIYTSFADSPVTNGSDGLTYRSVVADRLSAIDTNGTLYRFNSTATRYNAGNESTIVWPRYNQDTNLYLEYGRPDGSARIRHDLRKADCDFFGSLIKPPFQPSGIANSFTWAQSV